MSLAVGPYGIEYDPRQRDSSSPVIRRLVFFILLGAVITLVATSVRRSFFTRSQEDELPPSPPVLVQETFVDMPSNDGALKKVDELPPAEIVTPTGVESRPVKVRNLLLRLEEAEKRRDVAMAVTTIEQICSLPGDPAHDLYDKLYKRAGELNLKWLFEEKNAQWVSTVVVKTGDSATRLAHRNGSTLASLQKLNPKVDTNRIRVGDKLFLMSRPRFNLIVHTRARTADLKLNGRFFKRYDLRDEVTGEVGAYEINTSLRNMFTDKGISFDKSDRDELELLVPQGALLLISEL